MYEDAVTKGNQTLLRYRANQIADYEALRHNEPNYIYYIGQSSNFEKWYASVKEDGQVPIYKDIEEKCPYLMNVFKKADYDDDSIWKYNEEILEIEAAERKLQEAEIMKRDAKKLLRKLRNPHH